MAYQVLARKWRPQDFSSLVGQENIVTALRNALKEGRIAQAYLFSGIRGVGKTTAARVLAKALNCDQAPAPDPCNQCASCLEITQGKNVNFREIDAATYSKVEQIRELTEILRAEIPTVNRYNIVVIDEIHRLSRPAFDALLKIVEEPPDRLIFIFATTEIDAVPATVLSRCQEFQFRRVPSPLMVDHLRTICTAEEIVCSDNALRLIARSGEGSVRDSVALLDQLATFGSGRIDDDDAQRLLGGLDVSLFLALLGGILDGNQAAVVRELRKVEENGWDPHHVFGQFLAFCRDALHLALGTPPEAVDLTREDADALARQVRPVGYERLLQVMQVLLGSEALVKRSDFGLLALEIVALRAAELPKVVRIEELLGEKGPKAAELELRERPPALELKAPRRRSLDELLPEPPRQDPPDRRPPVGEPPPEVDVPEPPIDEPPPAYDDPPRPPIDEPGPRPAIDEPRPQEPVRLRAAALRPATPAVALEAIPPELKTTRAVFEIFGGRLQGIRDDDNHDEELPA